MNVSIIIVNYNTVDLLKACLETVLMYTKDIDYEVLVVDNCSKDDSVEMLMRDFSWVKVILPQENLGFGRANNLAAKTACGKYLLFLNPDTLLLNNAVKMFYDFMETCNHDGDIGAIGGILLTADGQPNNSFGRFPSIKSEIAYLVGKILRRQTPLIQSSRLPFEVDYIIGADLFVETKLFRAIGEFDSNIFLYYEETDLQRRIANIEKKRIILPQVNIIHMEGGSFDGAKLTYERFVRAQISFNYYINKHYSGIRKVGFRMVMSLLRLTLFCKPWTFSQRLKGYKLTICK